ncbi:stage V sporulation protein AA [Paenibacillus shunpengii]|uniref:Stage V sporulation protein AA n=1 Tax=Paenibacillus shunpengii TaxID=2054424 RepID=A0ABW5ST90_9BACL|nr:stage V sporulation protein AA [Paenibacillus sp. PDC88]SDW53586.1 stage V sporulation protein AA [Paenibacillus sp. PDC88]
MTAPSTPIIYVRLHSRIKMKLGVTLKIRHVAHVLTDPPGLEDKVLEAELMQTEKKDGSLLLVDVLQIIGRIQKIVPGATIETLGSSHTLVELIPHDRPPSKSLFVLVWLLLFFGSALTIMNFHADVNMKEVHIRIVEMLTGYRDENPYLFQTAYSIGIGFGMAVFFNHLFKKKWNDEPTPLEVEMYLYQQNVDQYAVNEEYERIKKEHAHSGQK